MLIQYVKSHHRKYKFFAKKIIFSQNQITSQNHINHCFNISCAKPLSIADDTKHKYIIIFLHKFYKIVILLDRELLELIA